jgi:hypothetical protein
LHSAAGSRPLRGEVEVVVEVEERRDILGMISMPFDNGSTWSSAMETFEIEEN